MPPPGKGALHLASISIKDVTKLNHQNHQQLRLNHVSLDVEDGEFVVLVGPKQSGKTKLLRIIAGLEKADSGEIYFDGRRMTDRTPQERNIGMVFQNDALFPAMNVYDNIAFSLRMRKLEPQRVHDRVMELADQFGIVDILKMKPRELSFIQRQHAALARAVAPRPSILLMDDPLIGVDENSSRKLAVEILRLQRELKQTVLYVTCNQLEGLRMATRVVVMKDGTVQQMDTPQNVYDFPVNRYVGRFIGAPDMNQFPVKLEKYGQSVCMSFGEWVIPLPAGKVARLVSPDYIGKTVILGMRAENIHDEAAFLSISEDSVVEAKVTIVEMLGMATYLHLKIDGVEDIVIANVEARCTAREGEVIRVALDMNHVHLFDAETGESILARTAGNMIS